MSRDQDKYIKGLQADKDKTIAYYNKSLATKTEQQKMLERLLDAERIPVNNIADIACGGGTLSYHLNSKFPDAKFTLVDFNEDAIEAARQNNPGQNFSFHKDSIYELKSIQENSFDLVFCWQTLSWLDEPQKALRELVRIVKPGGKIYASSLFNLEKDVDLYTKVFDYTHESGKQGIPFSYNTYSKMSVEKWLDGSAKKFDIVPFDPEIDFEFSGRGIGTYTVRTEGGKRLQISAGMLMNWGILIIQK